MTADGWQRLSVDAIKAKTEGAIAIGPFGSRMKSDLYVPTGVPVIRGNNISDTRELGGEFVYVAPETADELRPSNVFPGDIFFPHRGAIGQVGIVPSNGEERYVLSTSLMKLTCDRSLADPGFVFYFFRSPEGRHELLKHASTVGTPGIGQPLRSLKAISITIPPLSEQRAIAHILGTLDDKIELNRQMNETLEAIARALFKSWFVDFEPVRAKTASRSPGLPKPLADLFPDSLEDSELGEIPKQWRIGTLGDIAEINAKMLRRADKLAVVDYIEISEVMRGGIGSVIRYERGMEPSRARRCLRHGDSVLSTVRPDRGAHFLCLNPSRTLIASTGFAVLSPRDSNWAFLYSAVSRPEVGAELGRLAEGGAYPAVRPETVAALSVIMPKESRIASTFQKLTAPLFERAQHNRVAAKSLAALRDTLLPKLISGELRIPDAEALASGV